MQCTRIAFWLPTCDVLLEQLLGVVGVVLPAALPEPLLHVHHRPLRHRLWPRGRGRHTRRRRRRRGRRLLLLGDDPARPRLVIRFLKGEISGHIFLLLVFGLVTSYKNLNILMLQHFACRLPF